MQRRALLTLPLLALLPHQSRAAAPAWRHDVSELRAAIPDGLAAPWGRALRVTLRPVGLGGAALVRAVHRGQVEFGRCGTASVRAGLRDQLGDRLLWPRHDRFMLASLPHAMRSDIARLLQGA